MLTDSLLCRMDCTYSEVGSQVIQLPLAIPVSGGATRDEAAVMETMRIWKDVYPTGPCAGMLCPNPGQIGAYVRFPGM